MSRKMLPPLELLNELFSYDPKTGILSWRVSRRQVRPGDIAGWIGVQGYRSVGINKRIYLAHRIIWKMQTGNDPLNDIDHRDLVKSNNVWDNLRAATNSQNRANMRLLASNVSGIRGVSWHPKRRRWVANIAKDGKRHHLGYFTDLSEAAAVYKAKYLELYGSFARAA